MVASVATRPSSRLSAMTRNDSSVNDGFVGAEALLQHDRERGVGGLEAVAVVLELLDLVEHRRRLLAREVDAELGGLHRERGATGEFAHDDTREVARRCAGSTCS